MFQKYDKTYINPKNILKGFPPKLILYHSQCWLIFKGFFQICSKISTKYHTDAKLKFDFVSVKMTTFSWSIGLLLITDCFLLGNLFFFIFCVICLNNKHSVSYQSISLCFMLTSLYLNWKKHSLLIVIMKTQNPTMNVYL